MLPVSSPECPFLLLHGTPVSRPMRNPVLWSSLPPFSHSPHSGLRPFLALQLIRFCDQLSVRIQDLFTAPAPLQSWLGEHLLLLDGPRGCSFCTSSVRPDRNNTHCCLGDYLHPSGERLASSSGHFSCRVSLVWVKKLKKNCFSVK